MNNYPPGVSGLEPEIEGPLREEEVVVDFVCKNCVDDGRERWGFLQLYRDKYWIVFWDCPSCGTEYVKDGYDENGWSK